MLRSGKVQLEQRQKISLTFSLVGIRTNTRAQTTAFAAALKTNQMADVVVIVITSVKIYHCIASL
jgi:hypothetical protein